MERVQLAMAALLLGLPRAAPAEILPAIGAGDPHIQSVLYDEAQVVLLRVAAGYALTLAFSPDERIETVALGDSSAWQVQSNRRADHLVVKAASGAPETNMTVITDARSYNFKLVGAAPGPDLPYLISFTYPPPAIDAGQDVQVEQGRYRVRGSRALRPSAISDDGRSTTIIWPNDITLPAVYQVDAAGNEALVNGLMQDGAYVIEGVHPQLVFKRGRARATATRLTDTSGSEEAP